MKGYLQVYTGNGKGKTTAAFGLAIRAAGAGLRTYIAQFAKGRKCSEHRALARLSDAITVKQYGNHFFLHRDPDPEDIRIAQKGLEEVRKVMLSGKYDIIILDEADIAAYYDLFSVEDLLELIHARPQNIEMVITGRYAEQRVIEEADLVTEMKEIKHYYKQGVMARDGIEK
ncbi:MAG: cob(I)yrinic acid a,c-diamide adenosyltransferase [Deltaproteobacteria bacterium]|nr:MAG: cob(I)yrinic acid a,c-diamide adenosyltransferase [Deltaproteobacteria bacterium]